MRRLVLLMLMLCLSACGFRLRGMIDLPVWLNNVALVSEEGNNDLLMPLKMQLQVNKISINPDPAKADYWLVIVRSNYEQTISSIAASTTPRQYQLALHADFMLRTLQGLVKIPVSHITITRQITINNDRILGSSDEVNLTLNAMRREAAIQIVNKLGMQG